MKLALMQPYTFPYLGYFQLVSAVDTFVFYDDVTFIKQGWINRNRLLGNQCPLLFTIPLQNASSFNLINEVRVTEFSYLKWSTKFMKTLEHYYSRAPYYESVQPLISSVIHPRTELISDLAIKSIKAVCSYVGIERRFVDSSVVYRNSELKSEERVIDICCQERANYYLNPIGGVKLYSRERFSTAGVTISFLQTLDVNYRQFKHEFVPWLSIIDVLMFNSPDEVSRLLTNFELV